MSWIEFNLTVRPARIPRISFENPADSTTEELITRFYQSDQIEHRSVLTEHDVVADSESTVVHTVGSGFSVITGWICLDQHAGTVSDSKYRPLLKQTIFDARTGLNSLARAGIRYDPKMISETT